MRPQLWQFGNQKQLSSLSRTVDIAEQAGGMMIYVDEIRDYGKKGQWAHMWTDGSEDELHEFAAYLNLKREWLHVSKGIIGRFAHYDVSPIKRKAAIQMGAVEMPLKEWIASKIVRTFSALPRAGGRDK